MDEYLGGRYLDPNLKQGVLNYLDSHFRLAATYLGGAVREAITQAPPNMFLDEITIRPTTLPTLYVIELDYLEEGNAACEIAVENGFEGSVEQWVDSLLGTSSNTTEFTEERMSLL